LERPAAFFGAARQGRVSLSSFQGASRGSRSGGNSRTSTGAAAAAVIFFPAAEGILTTEPPKPWRPDHRRRRRDGLARQGAAEGHSRRQATVNVQNKSCDSGHPTPSTLRAVRSKGAVDQGSLLKVITPEPAKSSGRAGNFRLRSHLSLYEQAVKIEKLMRLLQGLNSRGKRGTGQKDVNYCTVSKNPGIGQAKGGPS